MELPDESPLMDCQCYCYAIMTSLCFPCQVKVHLLHLTASPHGELSKNVQCQPFKERARSPRSVGSNRSPSPNGANKPDCNRCEQYMAFINKLTSGLCEENIMEIICSNPCLDKSDQHIKPVASEKSSPEKSPQTNHNTTDISSQRVTPRPSKVSNTINTSKAKEQFSPILKDKPPLSTVPPTKKIPNDNSIKKPLTPPLTTDKMLKQSFDSRSKIQISTLRSQSPGQRNFDMKQTQKNVVNLIKSDRKNVKGDSVVTGEHKTPKPDNKPATGQIKLPIVRKLSNKDVLGSNKEILNKKAKNDGTPAAGKFKKDMLKSKPQPQSSPVSSKKSSMTPKPAGIHCDRETCEFLPGIQRRMDDENIQEKTAKGGKPGGENGNSPGYEARQNTTIVKKDDKSAVDGGFFETAIIMEFYQSPEPVAKKLESKPAKKPLYEEHEEEQSDALAEGVVKRFCEISKKNNTTDQQNLEEVTNRADYYNQQAFYDPVDTKELRRSMQATTLQEQTPVKEGRLSGSGRSTSPNKNKKPTKTKSSSNTAVKKEKVDLSKSKNKSRQLDNQKNMPSNQEECSERQIGKDEPKYGDRSKNVETPEVATGGRLSRPSNGGLAYYKPQKDDCENPLPIKDPSASVIEGNAREVSGLKGSKQRAVDDDCEKLPELFCREYPEGNGTKGAKENGQMKYNVKKEDECEYPLEAFEYTKQVDKIETPRVSQNHKYDEASDEDCDYRPGSTGRVVGNNSLTYDKYAYYPKYNETEKGDRAYVPNESSSRIDRIAARRISENGRHRYNDLDNDECEDTTGANGSLGRMNGIPRINKDEGRYSKLNRAEKYEPTHSPSPAHRVSAPKISDSGRRNNAIREDITPLAETQNQHMLRGKESNNYNVLARDTSECTPQANEVDERGYINAERGASKKMKQNGGYSKNLDEDVFEHPVKNPNHCGRLSEEEIVSRPAGIINQLCEEPDHGKKGIDRKNSAGMREDIIDKYNWPDARTPSFDSPPKSARTFKPVRGNARFSDEDLERAIVRSICDDRTSDDYRPSRSRSPDRKKSKSPKQRRRSTSGATRNDSTKVYPHFSEYMNPDSEGFKSKSAGNMVEERCFEYPYYDVAMVKSSPGRGSAGWKSGIGSEDKRVYYRTDSEGKCTSMVIGLPDDNSNSNPHIRIDFNKNVKTEITCYKVDKSEQKNDYRDTGTQSESPDREYTSPEVSRPATARSSKNRVPPKTTTKPVQSGHTSKPTGQKYYAKTLMRRSFFL